MAETTAERLVQVARITRQVYRLEHMLSVICPDEVYRYTDDPAHSTASKEYAVAWNKPINDLGELYSTLLKLMWSLADRLDGEELADSIDPSKDANP